MLTRQPRGDDESSRPRLSRSADARHDEAVGLASAIDLNPVHTAVVTVADPRPATLLGSGKVAEFADIVKERKAELVIVDHPLTPVQQRNLEKELNAKVLDRTGLILEIFGERARTKEGTLQVELAHLNYQKGRLVRSWTHLERQRGGAGFLGGPGETQIESDRRILQDKITKLKHELETVRRTRDLHRAKRKKVPFPVVAIVGYTNAGKSTLFNRLTGAGVLAEDMLFATLDPTLRRVRLPHGTPVILSDTVGFISDLPTHLVAAFRATLEEVVEADLVLHLRDISDPDTAAQAEDVERILADLGVDAQVSPFFTDMAARIGAAQLVMSRSGASTVSEIAVIGRPALLVPYPHALDHDQAANAAALAAAGGAELHPQSTLSAERIAELVGGLIEDPNRLATMAAAARSAGKPNAARLLADLTEAIASGKTVSDYRRTRA
ncbi:GTPase HflX [Mesorhizobium sp. M2C.T.Ca.TU.002.02.1.1]|uniref:GTPase HflX n=1 Tax=Mesorhizobium sp. M2C.T.Ca.TU.002.02.1.1 TaxID=2496788 RepID=UPI002478EF91|nr:GTPase HflX [Mesorhizobium sp. M2C.T.Ca.TU.002.02.1.1]